MIEDITHNNINEVLPLIRKYQEFYNVPDVNDEKNEIFFSKFIESDDGVLHLYRHEGKVIGFSTTYNGFSSTRAETVAVLNDLFISSAYRGKGYGKELIENAVEVAKSKGYSRIQWLTAQDNEVAQKLYNTLGANKSDWIFYAKET